MICALIVMGALGVVLPTYVAFTSYRDRIYEDLADVPSAPVAVVFGAGVAPNGRPSPMLADRVDAAVALYKAGKVGRILMTGDNSRPDYDEVTAMKRHAVASGVPAQHVNLDYAGFRTYDSCYRARVIFGVERAILVTQGYHLPRALYLANRMGIDAFGLKAGLDNYRDQRYYDLREAAALLITWYEVNLLQPQPRFLGEPVDLERQNQAES
jgi:vancomycin permeability regulator SanA